ncbi:potassium/sodium efflux P-type ATPase, fungal-type [Allomyces macrogynus ATCC 38327]|uniref:Potassium/sodium efflux P-type ATPase, fungal-type n=1 Tax=Allomyces macrogynus (strain ATCC 38327) TaxID=578462 RepID=A0A0L0TCS7_ALLM3|nr:potassium/sodium efflux P-type ATPase, fungal-type [Allomyces macrogynus ATCC 38327]|eukprot:KNE72470.1 potassium/sodium efflux P-type ATPase, fungal-type [Allomyces macrogynus ATCC 38327]
MTSHQRARQEDADDVTARIREPVIPLERIDTDATLSRDTSFEKDRLVVHVDDHETTTGHGPRWYEHDLATVARMLDTDLAVGLTENEAAHRLVEFGPNDLGGDNGPSAWRVLISNLVNPMNGILAVALAIALIARDWVEGAVLVVVILTNTLLGFRQEYKSEKTMEALRKLASPTAMVIRGGMAPTLIAAPLLVPGDLVLLAEGDQVPADLRVIDAVNLAATEALLTGEPIAVRKSIDPIVPRADMPAHAILPLGDQVCMAFKSTTVAYGRGKGIVTATGMKTAIGTMAAQVAAGSKARAEAKTPLERSMMRMMMVCLGVALVLGVIVFAVNKWKLTDTQVLLYAIATAVAILPESLPAVLTVIMAFGVSTMAKQRAIVRRLASLEELGQVTHICSDKTGTLTEGTMAAVAGWVLGAEITITGAFHAAGGIEGLSRAALEPVLRVMGLCHTCSITLDETTKMYSGTGDTTEIALAVAAHRQGQTKESAENVEFVTEYPFDATLKCMSVVYRNLDANQFVILTKGAVEAIVARSAAYQVADPTIAHAAAGHANEIAATVHVLTPEYVTTEIMARAEFMAAQGLRVLALAHRHLAITSTNELKLQEPTLRSEYERDLVFLGLVGIMDPPRAETAGAVAACQSAGIVVHMITGDHPATAAAIAKKIGLLSDADAGNPARVMVAPQWDALSDEQVDAMDELPLVLARCSPETKVKMIQALHRRGQTVAMTGDGVNDAPAISYADVGIAMGLGGADVTKQASDLTLTDDCFATIVQAIAQGRRIFTNIQKFTLHLLSGNVSEVVALIIGLAFSDGNGSPIFPMSPIQILWINLVTSSPIALALAVEPADDDVMRVSPRRHGVFTRELMADTLVNGAVMGALTLVQFVAVAYLHAVDPLHSVVPTASCNKVFTTECEAVFRARAVAFVTLSLLLLVHGLNCRSPRTSVLRTVWRDAKVLVVAMMAGLVVIAPLPYLPVINTKVFQHAPFDYEWGYIAATLVVFMLVAEAYKAAKRAWWPVASVVMHDDGDDVPGAIVVER